MIHEYPPWATRESNPRTDSVRCVRLLVDCLLARYATHVSRAYCALTLPLLGVMGLLRSRAFFATRIRLTVSIARAARNCASTSASHGVSLPLFRRSFLVMTVIYGSDPNCAT